MKKIIYFLVTIFLFLFTLSNCDKKDDTGSGGDPNDTIPPYILANEHLGQLHLYLSNEFPEFQANGSVDVKVDREGKMEFGSGGLQYSGTSDNGQSKIKREGEIIMMPHGSYFMQGDEVYFNVNENSTLTEQMTVWYWTGTSWQMAVDETISEAWNGGLVFSLIDAVIDGSVVSVTTEMGTVEWTLTLSPVAE